MRHVMMLATVLAMAGADSAFGETKFTPATGPGCKDESSDQFGQWTCPGPAGYAIRFADEGNIVSLTIAPRRSLEKRQGPSAQWRGAGKAFGDKVQWIMRAGIPKAAVIRTWHRQGDDESEIQELSIFAINPESACLYAAIDSHTDKANETALARAEQAADSRCPEK
ncbi:MULTISPECIES: hypothetical protein [unclassified Bradyrhizobium]|uniref:hypothetical protein n=1 Tax=unclassified Bradyrhizobium TaxID=2631580 RepID=UPI00247A4383|nr:MULTISPECIES: hypothetical protein [unclassified Bradyrhizobium]WGR67892.1 hypothetical protein MTX24_20715 [Bradyrhizobium sp. ISRA426]WGR79945.1 hypothetical protein MTX21_05830 [Bradyrhizobium sp. ISRA430]WGR83131.1 hypothetical protein MTX25_20395 [Bradyrhizobium sp. ISRA432]